MIYRSRTREDGSGSLELTTPSGVFQLLSGSSRKLLVQLSSNSFSSASTAFFHSPPLSTVLLAEFSCFSISEIGMSAMMSSSPRTRSGLFRLLTWLRRLCPPSFSFVTQPSQFTTTMRSCRRDMRRSSSSAQLTRRRIFLRSSSMMRKRLLTFQLMRPPKSTKLLLSQSQNSLLSDRKHRRLNVNTTEALNFTMDKIC